MDCTRQGVLVQMLCSSKQWSCRHLCVCPSVSYNWWLLSCIASLCKCPHIYVASGSAVDQRKEAHMCRLPPIARVVCGGGGGVSLCAHGCACR